MKRYTVCVTDHRYHYIQIEAETPTQATNRVWDQIGQIVQREPDDIDTDVVVDSVEEISL
jgi:hypothetical protein